MTQRSPSQKLTINLIVPEIRVADVQFNSLQIQAAVERVFAVGKGFQLILFPQLCLTAFSCEDLFDLPLLAEEAFHELINLEKLAIGRECLLLIGLPLRQHGKLYDAVALVNGSGLLGFALNPNPDPTWFTNASAFDADSITMEGRTFPAFRDPELPFQTLGYEIQVRIGVLLQEVSLSKGELLLNPTALPALADLDYSSRFELLTQDQQGVLAVCSAGATESTSQKVYSGLAQLWHAGKKMVDGPQLSFQSEISSLNLPLPPFENAGNTLKEAVPKRGSTTPWLFDPTPESQLERLFEIQTAGLLGRMRHTRSKTMVLGLSGGADSSMALLVCCRAAERLGISPKSILGVTMPGPGSSQGSLERAQSLIRLTGIDYRQNEITESVYQHLREIGHDLSPDITFENAQARYRTLHLMNYANLRQGLVVGTGDLSEIALGWSTYNGDQMSMYNVNAGLPKTVLLKLLPWAAERMFGREGLDIAQMVVQAPVSPELQPLNSAGQSEQITEETLGPYQLHDCFLWHAIAEKSSPEAIYSLARTVFGAEYSASFILLCLRRFYERFFRHQFKRAASPDGPQLFTLSLDAGSGWRMPSDASPSLWLKEIDGLQTALEKSVRDDV